MTTNDIAKINDRFRLSLGIPAFSGGIPGRVVATAGITALSPESITAILDKLRAFSSFTQDNDPHGEHDFGAFDHGGQRIFWKIDYYAPDLIHGSENPADLSQTVRVLTILLASEW
jgi:Protein of unknown function (DUF3768)